MSGADTLFSAADLAALRRLNEANLPHRLDFFVPTLSEGDGGVSSWTYPTTPTTAAVPCRVRAQGGLPLESVVAGAQGSPGAAYLVVLAAGTPVPPTAKARITGETPVTGADPVPFELWLDVQGPPLVTTYEMERKALGVVTAAVPNADPVPVTPTSTTVTLSSPTATVGATAPTVSRVVGPTGASQAGAWSSTDAAVATIDPSTGVITLVGAGTVAFTFTPTGHPEAAGVSETLTVEAGADVGTPEALLIGNSYVADGTIVAALEDQLGPGWDVVGSGVVNRPSEGLLTDYESEALALYDSAREQLACVVESTNDLTGGGTTDFKQQKALLGLVQYCQRLRWQGYKVLLMDSYPLNDAALTDPYNAALNVLAPTFLHGSNALVRISQDPLMGTDALKAAHPEYWGGPLDVHPSLLGYTHTGEVMAPAFLDVQGEPHTTPPLLFTTASAKLRHAMDPRHGAGPALDSAVGIQVPRKGFALVYGTGLGANAARPTIVTPGAAGTTEWNFEAGGQVLTEPYQMSRYFWALVGAAGFSLTVLLRLTAADLAKSLASIVMGAGDLDSPTSGYELNAVGGRMRARLFMTPDSFGNRDEAITTAALTAGRHAVTATWDRAVARGSGRCTLIVDGAAVAQTETNAGVDGPLAGTNAHALGVNAHWSGPQEAGMSGCGGLLVHDPLTAAETIALHAEIAASGWTGG